MDKPYVKSAQMNPSETSPFYYDQDLANNRLTWRLYEVGDEKGGAILRGFYVSGKEFNVSHGYSDGMGDTIGTSIKVGLREALRTMASKSRDLYNNREGINNLKNSAMNLIDDGGGKKAAIDATGALLGSGISSMTGMGSTAGAVAGVAAGEWLQNQDWFSKAYDNAISDAKNFDIGKEWNNVLKHSKVVTQGSKSKIYSETNIGLPSIGSLKCRYWTSSSSDKVTDFINDTVSRYFMGKFVELDGGGGGYWTAPNDLDIVQDDATSLTDVKGAFVLKAGRYEFRNVLIKSITWEYSRELANLSDDDSDDSGVPAYADITLDLELYKYPTPGYLKTITG